MYMTAFERQLKIVIRQVIERVTVAAGGKQTGSWRMEERGMWMTWKHAAPICWHGNVNNVFSVSLIATLTLQSRYQGNRINSPIYLVRQK